MSLQKNLYKTSYLFWSLMSIYMINKHIWQAAKYYSWNLLVRNTSFWNLIP